MAPAARTSAALTRLMIQLCSCCAVAPAWAQDADDTALSGSARVSYFSSSRDLNDLDDVAVASAEIELRHLVSEDQRLEVEQLFAGICVKEWRTETHGDLTRAIIDWPTV